MSKYLLLIIILLSLVSCDRNAVSVPEKISNGINYSIVTIEGMPCMVVKSLTKDINYVTSITCDWSKWEGNK